MFCVLYGMIITDVTALVLEVLCAKYFLMKKTPQKWEQNRNTGEPHIYQCVHLLQIP